MCACFFYFSDITINMLFYKRAVNCAISYLYLRHLFIIDNENNGQAIDLWCWRGSGLASWPHAYTRTHARTHACTHVPHTSLKNEFDLNPASAPFPLVGRLSAGRFGVGGGGGGGRVQPGEPGPVLRAGPRAAHQQHPAAVEKAEEPHGETGQPR